MEYSNYGFLLLGAVIEAVSKQTCFDYVEKRVFTLPIRATSVGGGDSTVKDLLAFANALTSNKLLDAEHTKLLTTG